GLAKRITPTFADEFPCGLLAEPYTAWTMIRMRAAARACPTDSAEIITSGRPMSRQSPVPSESSLSGHEAGLGLLSRCPGDDPVHQTRDTSRAVPAHICNGNGGLEHTKPLVRYPLCQARCLSLD